MQNRAPLQTGRLASPGWRYLVLPEAGSTNAEAAARYRAGEPAGLVVVTEHQTAGRGRLDRVWETPARTSLTASFLVEPAGPVGRWPWLPLATGLAVLGAVARCAGSASPPAALKWPNDVLVEDRKLAGILVERIEHGGTAAAVIGVGVNVDQDAAELPPETAGRAATSLRLEGTPVDRTDLLLALARSLADRLGQWRDDPRGLAVDYRAACATLGRDVTVHLPGGKPLRGRAVGIAEDGRLDVVDEGGRSHRLGAGDVVHVRPGHGFVK